MNNEKYIYLSLSIRLILVLAISMQTLGMHDLAHANNSAPRHNTTHLRVKIGSNTTFERMEETCETFASHHNDNSNTLSAQQTLASNSPQPITDIPLEELCTNMRAFTLKHPSFPQELAVAFFGKFNNRTLDMHLNVPEQIDAAQGDEEILKWLQSIGTNPDDPLGEVSLNELTCGIKKAIDENHPILIKLFMRIVGDITKNELLRHFLIVHYQLSIPDQLPKIIENDLHAQSAQLNTLLTSLCSHTKKLPTYTKLRNLLPDTVREIQQMPEGYTILTNGLGTRSIVEVSESRLFNPITAAYIRKYIVDQLFKQSPFLNDKNLFRTINKSHYSTIIPTNECDTGCPQCSYGIKPGYYRNDQNQQIMIQDIPMLIHFLNQANGKTFVFSGGGDPSLNVAAMCAMITMVPSLENIMIITSNKFSESEERVSKILTALANANEARIRKKLDPVKIVFRVSWDDGTLKVIDPVSAHNLVSAIDTYRQQGNTQFSVVFRTLFYHTSELSYAEKMLENLLDGTLTEKEFEQKVFPYCTLVRKNGAPIRVVYRPAYHVGRWKNIKKKNQAIFDATINAIKDRYGGIFIATHGPKGQGYVMLPEFTKEAIQDDETFQLATYISAIGVISLGGGVPDNGIHHSEFTTWEDFLKMHLLDPLQRFGIENGVLGFPEIAQEVAEKLWDEIRKTNFILSIPLLSMKNSSLRLYLTIRILQMYRDQGLLDLTKMDTSIVDILNIPQPLLVKMFKEDMNTPLAASPDILKNANGGPIDPVTGEEQTLQHLNFIAPKPASDFIQDCFESHTKSVGEN